MEKSQIKELRKLIEEVIYSHTKKDAKAPLELLKYKASLFDGKIDPYLFGKLRDAINYAKQASGKVQDKDHWISNVNNSWYYFEAHINDEDRTE